MLDAVALKRPQVVAIPQLAEELLENGPIAVAARPTELPLQMPLEIGLDAVIVQERVIDVHQEYDRAGRGHHSASDGTGSCHASPRMSTPSASLGPQVPGS